MGDNCFSIKGANGETLPSDKINFKGVNFVSDKVIDENNRANMELIEEWVRPARVHDGHAIVVSAGPTLDVEEIKKVMLEHPNHKVICVKHAFQKLVDAGITPWGLCVLDTRPVTEVSSLRKNRLKLIQGITDETIAFVLTRCHPSYTFFFQKKGIRVMGYHNHIDEIARCLNMTEKEFENDKSELVREIKQSLLTLPGSCAAICAMNLMIFYGFRNIHLFGFDGSVASKADTDDPTQVVACGGKDWIVPNEFVSYGLEFRFIYRHYPRDLNVNLRQYGLNSFLGSLYKEIRPFELGSFEEVIDKPLEKSIELDEAVAKVFGGYFNKPVRNKEMVVRGYKNYEDYRKIQTIGNKGKNNWVFVSREVIHKLSEWLADHVGVRDPMASRGDAGSVKGIKMGLCHGSRGGFEQRWFREELVKMGVGAGAGVGVGGEGGEGLKVIGTEISDTASNFENTIQWDFHEIKPEWDNGGVDFIYSNSLDHSYDPEMCLQKWMKCVRKGGVCFLEWTATHDRHVASHLDPFGASLDGYRELISRIDGAELKETLELGGHSVKCEEKAISPPFDRIILVVVRK